MFDPEAYQRLEDRLRALGMGVLIGTAGMLVVLIWLR